MSIIKDMLSGTGEGLFSGLGKLAKNIRESITGKEVITAEERKILMNQLAELEIAVLQAENKINLAQIELNKSESESTSSFRGNWRPAIGWVCVFGLCYQFLIMPIFPWTVKVITILSATSFSIPSLPSLDIGTLMTIIMGMLGLGGMRTFEKIKGIK